MVGRTFWATSCLVLVAVCHEAIGLKHADSRDDLFVKILPTPDRFGHRSEVPNCATNYTGLIDATLKYTNTWCLYDYDYPVLEIENALFYHHHSVASMYKDVLADTSLSVTGISSLSNELYICPTTVRYVQPLRALNAHGDWRIIVNHVKAKEGTVLSQTVRLEECHGAPGQPCNKIPACYETKCVQKSNYQRLLVFNPFEYYLPFAIETFKFPSSCDCYSATYETFQEFYTLTKKPGNYHP